MNPSIFGLCALLTACATTPPVAVNSASLPFSVNPAPTPKPTPQAEPDKPIVTENVAKAYQKVAQKEVPAVVAPNATPERVRSVHKADIAARRALSRLEAQGHHPTKEALEAAREAVKRLSDILSSQNE